jgi:hypothetical protein
LHRRIGRLDLAQAADDFLRAAFVDGDADEFAGGVAEFPEAGSAGEGEVVDLNRSWDRRTISIFQLCSQYVYEKVPFANDSAHFMNFRA